VVPLKKKKQSVKYGKDPIENIHLDQAEEIHFSCHYHVTQPLLSCVHVASKNPHQIKMIGSRPKTAVT
jgi:hypothetical protein